MFICLRVSNRKWPFFNPYHSEYYNPFYWFGDKKSPDDKLIFKMIFPNVPLGSGLLDYKFVISALKPLLPDGIFFHWLEPLVSSDSVFNVHLLIFSQKGLSRKVFKPKLLSLFPFIESSTISVSSVKLSKLNPEFEILLSSMSKELLFGILTNSISSDRFNCSVPLVPFLMHVAPQVGKSVWLFHSFLFLPSEAAKDRILTQGYVYNVEMEEFEQLLGPQGMTFYFDLKSPENKLLWFEAQKLKKKWNLPFVEEPWSMLSSKEESPLVLDIKDILPFVIEKIKKGKKKK